MWTLYHKIRFFFDCQRMQLKTWLLHFGCLLIPSWHFINHDCICTTAKVLKLNNIYTYEEGGFVDIVRLNDVYTDKGYLYCSLFFFSKNKITTVSQIMKKDTYIIWKLMDNEEYDKILSKRLWQEVNKQNSLLEFDF
jgi:hypothetical protein